MYQLYHLSVSNQNDEEDHHQHQQHRPDPDGLVLSSHRRGGGEVAVHNNNNNNETGVPLQVVTVPQRVLGDDDDDCSALEDDDDDASHNGFGLLDHSWSTQQRQRMQQHQATITAAAEDPPGSQASQQQQQQAPTQITKSERNDETAAAAAAEVEEEAPNNDRRFYSDDSYATEDVKAIFRILNTESSAFRGLVVPNNESSSSSLLLPCQNNNNNNGVSPPTTTTATCSNNLPPASVTGRDRATYISATILKPTKKTNLGFKLIAMADGAIRIESISPHGFLFVSGCPLRAGDQLVGIITTHDNNSDEGTYYSCGNHPTTNDGGGGLRTLKSKQEIVRLLRKTSGRITLMVQNDSGVPNRIESMTVKPHPNFGTGIYFVSSGVAGGESKLSIHSVPTNGLFAQSLLHPNDTVLSINDVDCSQLDANVATDIVKSAPRFVTIVTQTTSTAANRISMMMMMSATTPNTTATTYADPAMYLRSIPEVVGRQRRSSGRSSFTDFVFFGRRRKSSSVVS